MLASFLIAFLITAISMPRTSGYRPAKENVRMQMAHSIDLCMFQYSIDHDGKYPEGKSSTEIFQLLIDQQYITDPGLFYFSMPGKTKATTNKLKPENVCFDVTNAVLSDDPDALPIVFSTGYKIDYIQGGKAHFLPNGDPNGIAVCFKGNNAAFLRTPIEGTEGIPLFPPAYVHNAVPDFDPKDRAYRQLTPDGPLP